MEKRQIPPSLYYVQNYAQAKWERESVHSARYEENAEGRKFFLTTPMPYTDALMTLNRGYALSLADAIASYQSLKGKCILFSMFFHFGGTRIQVCVFLLLFSSFYCDPCPLDSSGTR
jgi:leucyl-tRNA synthetase